MLNIDLPILRLAMCDVKDHCLAAAKVQPAQVHLYGFAPMCLR